MYFGGCSCILVVVQFGSAKHHLASNLSIPWNRTNQHQDTFHLGYALRFWLCISQSMLCLYPADKWMIASSPARVSMFGLGNAITKIENWK
jgi:hypothetical protein